MKVKENQKQIIYELECKKNINLKHSGILRTKNKFVCSI